VDVHSLCHRINAQLYRDFMGTVGLEMLRKIDRMQRADCITYTIDRSKVCAYFPVGTPEGAGSCSPSLRRRSRSYFTTNSQSVSQYVLASSTLVGIMTRYYFLSECYCLKFAVLYLGDALSDERTGLQFAV
jgi:hypothetical protein